MLTLEFQGDMGEGLPGVGGSCLQVGKDHAYRNGFLQGLSFCFESKTS